MKQLTEPVRVLLAVAAVAAVGMILIATLNPAHAVAIAIIGLALLFFALLAYGVLEDKPYRLDQLVPLPKSTIDQHAFLWFTTAGWALAGSDAGALTFTRRNAPDFAPGLSFLLLGVLPSLLYYILGGRKLTLTVQTAAEAGGARLTIVVNTRASGGEATAKRFVNTLYALVPGAVSLPAHRVP